MEIVITFARTNETIHSERILEEAGLTVQIMPLPSVIRAGCGLCLRLPQKQVQNATALLEQANIPVQGLYTRMMTGRRSTYASYRGDTQ